jgi:hypothetical protein
MSPIADVDAASLHAGRYRLHQSQPFGGELDRISATCRAAFVAGQWETWF